MEATRQDEDERNNCDTSSTRGLLQLAPITGEKGRSKAPYLSPPPAPPPLRRFQAQETAESARLAIRLMRSRGAISHELLSCSPARSLALALDRRVHASALLELWAESGALATGCTDQPLCQASGCLEKSVVIGQVQAQTVITRCRCR